MHANIPGLISAGIAILLFAVIYTVLRQAKVLIRWLVLVVAGFLSLPALSLTVYYIHLLPSIPAVYELRSMPVAEFLFIPVGLAGGALAALLPRAILILPLFATCCTVLLPFAKPVVRPVDVASLKDEWSDGVCLQSAPSTCGPACLATILRFHEQRVSEAEIARETFTDKGGTEAWYLARAARARGMVVKFRNDYRPGGELVLPAMVGVRYKGEAHFVPILSEDNGAYWVGDPLRGRERLSVDELTSRYEFTGFAMSVTRQ